jgi:hypothetical protein
MELTALSADQAMLEAVRSRFEHWRKRRKKRESIPDALWEAAASLHPAFSISRISIALGLNYNDLKNHVQGQSSERSNEPDAAFIALDISNSIPSRPYTVEMHHRSGHHMSVEVSSSGDMIKLAQLFWDQS